MAAQVQAVPVRMDLQATSLAVFQGAEGSYENGITKLSGVGQPAFSVASVYVGDSENGVVAFDKMVEVTVMAVASDARPSPASPT
jgi:hypothetical protein